MMINFFYLHILLLHLLYIFPICFSSSDPDVYDNCGNNFTCGGTFTVGFPFWGGDLRPKECGYPDLELVCEGQLKTTIKIAETSFYILDVNPNATSLKIARQDLSDSFCLTKFANTTMNFNRFYYPLTSQNITILYGCPRVGNNNGGDSDSGSDLGFSHFYCRLNGVNSNNSYGYCQSGATGPNGCYKSVVVPVLATLEQQILYNASSDPSNGIDEGFEVIYKLQEGDADLCTSCQASNGRCGFDPGTSHATCYCSDGTYAYAPCGSKGPKIKKKMDIKIKISLIACSAIAVVCMLLILLLYVRRRRLSKGRELAISRREREVDVEAFLRSRGSSGPNRYTYTALKTITNSFRNKIGQGGYGSVYKGQLENGSLVAVKILHKSKGDTKEFINEVASIGNTNHVNIVKLFGFCYSRHRRALVYEYMCNGSLEKFLFTGNNHHSLGLEKLFEIAIGVARGLEYLHRGCNTRILHFDIKPHNILLDDKFCPKIADFGLAKSYEGGDKSILSMSEARGTIGYIAPEVFLKSFGGVTHKSDVYSYGMLVLEMVGCRSKANVEGEVSSEQYFPEWIYNQLEEENKIKSNQDGILSEEGIEMRRKMITVSLWCVKTNPSSRPTMSKVVEMLKGAVELEIPPLSSISGFKERNQTACSKSKNKG